MGYYIQRDLIQIEKDFDDILINNALLNKSEQGFKLARLMTEMEHTWENCRMWNSSEDEKTIQAKLYEKISNARDI